MNMLTYAIAVLHCVLLVFGQPVDNMHQLQSQPAVRKDLSLNSNFLHPRKLVDTPITRSKRTTDHVISECMTVVSSEGHYFYKSTSDDDSVCGVFLFTEPDRTVEIYFNYLDVPCDDGGLVSFVDGWELNGEFFPSAYDHPKPMKNRFSEFCGKRKLKQVFESSQNAAVIQYKVPRRSAGFSFTVRFPKNRTPCNVLLQDTEGVYTLRNYGKRSNCSITAIFPATAKLLSINVGLAGGHNALEVETGTIHKCQKRGLDDYVEIGGSYGLDTSHLYGVESLCGIDSKPGPDHVIFCDVTTVRLVSSGAYDNSVTVSLRQADVDELSLASTMCPLPDI